MTSPGCLRTTLPFCGFGRISRACHRFVLAMVACVSITALEPIQVSAQQWVDPRANPMAQTSAATHLVIEPPQPLKHHRSAHQGSPQVAMPTHQESVGGGYWNQTEDLSRRVVAPDGLMFDNQFDSADLPAPAPPKKKIDLTHSLPSHADKTPRSPAIPQASRTTGWKQPYSYGHFGANHNRQWSVHHGHQRSHTQWTFR